LSPHFFIFSSHKKATVFRTALSRIAMVLTFLIIGVHTSATFFCFPKMGIGLSKVAILRGRTGRSYAGGSSTNGNTLEIAGQTFLWGR
jgi:hypothetical protein